MRRLGLIVVLLATGCAVQTTTGGLPRGDRALPPPGLSEGPSGGRCAYHAAALPPLIGRQQAEVRGALATMPGIRSIRLLAPNQPATLDYREDRVSGVVREGVVESLACG